MSLDIIQKMERPTIILWQIEIVTELWSCLLVMRTSNHYTAMYAHTYVHISTFVPTIHWFLKFYIHILVGILSLLLKLLPKIFPKHTQLQKYRYKRKTYSTTTPNWLSVDRLFVWIADCIITKRSRSSLTQSFFVFIMT